jgi:cobalt/nickel transport system ATP-binding protein
LALIEVRGLEYRYPDGTHALRGVDFTLHEGETVVLLGANGSGKTTFVLHLNGLLEGGDHVQVDGLASTPRNLPAIRQRVGMVFQSADEQLFLPTVLDDVGFGLLNQGLSVESARAKAIEALNRVGLHAELQKAPYHLSAGEKRRVAIAGVLVMEPKVLVLDEPTTFLDPPGQRELLALLRSLPQAKILVTHDIAFAEALATRAVFFEAGRIVAEGSVAQLVERFQWRPS